MIDILEEWGKWSRHDWGTYSSPLYSLMKQHNPEFSIGWSCDVPNITDDEALKVDAAVAELARVSPVLANILKLKYISGNSLREISRYYLTPLEYPAQTSLEWGHKDKKRVHPQIVARLLDEAERCIGGML